MRKLLFYLGYLEGISYLMLFGLVVPLKYILDDVISISLSFYGTAQGLLLLSYIAIIFLFCLVKHLPWHYIITGTVLSILPFGPFLFEKKLRRRLKVNEYDQIFHKL